MPAVKTDEERIQEAIEDLHRGVWLHNIARSERSNIGYRPMASRRDYARALATLAALAERSDGLAVAVGEVIGRVPQYQTVHEMVAKIAEEFARFILKGTYRDTYRAAAPDAGRESDLHRALSDAEIIQIIDAVSFISEPQRDLGWLMAGVREHLRARPFPRPKTL